MDLETIGRKLKIARDRKGLSLEQAAPKVGVSKNKINQIEKGRGNVTIRTLQALADFFEFQLNIKLVGLEAEQRPGPFDVGPAARLLAALDREPLTKAVVLALALGEDQHIDSAELRADLKLIRSKLEVL